MSRNKHVAAARAAQRPQGHMPARRPKDPLRAALERFAPSAIADQINRPDIDTRPPGKVVEVPPWFPHDPTIFLRTYVLGECSIIVTRGYGCWHMSIAHPRRDPTWAEVAAARYATTPDDATMALILPPKAQYTNVHKYCFQLMEVVPRIDAAYAAGVDMRGGVR